MEIKLRTIGGGIHAVFYTGGTRTGDRNLGDEVVVREASAEEMADGPEKVPEITEFNGGTSVRTFTGFYVVPGSGLAAIFGAMRPEC